MQSTERREEEMALGVKRKRNKGREDVKEEVGRERKWEKKELE